MGKKRQRSGREVTSSPEPPEPTIVLDASDDQDDDVDPRQTMIVDKAVERGNQRKAKRQKRSKSKTTGDDSGGGVAAGAVAPVAGGAGLPSAEVETKEEDALPTGVKIVVKPQRETTPERAEDAVHDGENYEVRRLLRMPRYFDDDFELAALRCFRCGGGGHREAVGAVQFESSCDP